MRPKRTLTTQAVCPDGVPRQEVTQVDVGESVLERTGGSFSRPPWLASPCLIKSDRGAVLGIYGRGGKTCVCMKSWVQMLTTASSTIAPCSGQA